MEQETGWTLNFSDSKQTTTVVLSNDTLLRGAIGFMIAAIDQKQGLTFYHGEANGKRLVLPRNVSLRVSLTLWQEWFKLKAHRQTNEGE